MRVRNATAEEGSDRMDWVEVEGATVDEAVELALKEFGLQSKEDVNVDVIQEPKVGFLGMGGKDAIVRVTRAPTRRKRRRSRNRSGRSKDSTNGAQDSASRQDKQERNSKPKQDKQKSTPTKKPREEKQVSTSEQDRAQERTDDRPEQAPIEQQAEVAAGFISGLLDAFGLEGTVETRIEEDVLYIEVEGSQTEALVGPKGSVMQSVHELTRTVVQRKTYGAPRMRIDIAGYRARRREALTIYAGQLAEQVIDEKDEIMLEPMNAADRKVVHDAVSSISGVRSFSEGDEPRRSVVLSYVSDE